MRHSKVLALRALRLLTATLAVLVGGFIGAGVANAHGEDVQPPVLRTGTIQFYNVAIAPTDVRVGEPFTITGDFYVSRQWAEAVTEPRVTQLTVVQPGPVALVKDRRIGGEFIPESMELTKGKSYSFEIDLVARRVGTWHLHPVIMNQGAGPLMGPGADVTIQPGAGGATTIDNKVTLLNGEQVNLETYNRGTAVVWHLLYIVPAVLFLVYWLSKPLVRRLAMVVSGQREPDDFLTKRDVKVTLGAAGVILAVMVAGLVYSFSAWPDQIPLQVKNTATPAGVQAGNLVSASPVGSAMFMSEQDEVKFTVRFDNTGRERLSLQAFSTAGFLFDAKAGNTTNGAMQVSEPVTLAPGQSKEVSVTLSSEVWAKHNLIPGRETGNRLGGIFMFARPGGGVEIAEVSLPVITRTSHG